MTTTLEEGALEKWERDGFLVIEDFVDPGDLDGLRAAYDELLEGHVRAGGDRMLGGLTRQIMVPSSAHPTFDRNATVRKAIGLGRRLLGSPAVHRTFDMLIYKPPRHEHETPWHQDHAYFGRPTAPAGAAVPLDSIQLWIALDDADEENGCMHFVPGRHTDPLLEHHVAAGDPEDDGRLLAITDPERNLELSTVVAAPLRAGGCTMHTQGTPHFTPSNRSKDRPRRAYIFNVATPERLQRMIPNDTQASRDAPPL